MLSILETLQIIISGELQQLYLLSSLCPHTTASIIFPHSDNIFDRFVEKAKHVYNEER